MKQTKNISLVEYKAIDEGSGGFSAYATIFGELDDTGDIILAGAYQNTIPQFLKRGFIARSHDWSTTIGMPVGAREDAKGLLVDARYHNTMEAQNQRIITNERNQAGLDSFVSIGYEPASSPIYIQPSDYASEIPKYSTQSLVQQNLAKAAGFPEVRVLPEIQLYEISLVQVPALASAVVTGAKNMDGETDDLGTGLEYAARLDRLGTAIKEFTAHTEARISMRTKEGRVLSSANWQALADMVDQMDELSKRVRSMLDEAKPKPKEDAPEEGKQLDIQAVLNHLMVMDLQLKGVPIK